MAEVVLGSSGLGNSLQTLLMSPDIEPGDDPSYQTCKALYLYHPFGRKMAEAPTMVAQSQKREIVIGSDIGDRCRNAFLAEWKKLRCDKHIFNVMRLSRIYGVSSIAILIDGVATDEPLDPEKLASQAISFNVFDPLNTAGSLVLNQNPNDTDFQKHVGITVNGKHYHRSREVTVLNEEPIYIAFTSSAFGFVGRSVYQRALYPLKSFIQTMRTDDLVAVKVGVIIAKIKQAGAIISQGMKELFGLKRNILKEATTGNVISIGPDDEISSIDMQNLDRPFDLARKNIIKNIATAADMPAMMLENETMVSGFGEGTEDAKNIAKFIDRHREEMEPVYDWFDQIVMRRAWTKGFYDSLVEEFGADFRGVSFETAFYQWKNKFAATWPSLLTEPDSEKAKAASEKLKSIMQSLQIMLPEVDPHNKAIIFEWAQNAINALGFIFPDDLELDLAALQAYIPPMLALAEAGEDKMPPPAKSEAA